MPLLSLGGARAGSAPSKYAPVYRYLHQYRYSVFYRVGLVFGVADRNFEIPQYSLSVLVTDPQLVTV